jgi:hypothetical protein
MTIKYGLQFFFFFELTDNDGQNFLAGIVLWRTKNFERSNFGISKNALYCYYDVYKLNRKIDGLK